MVDEMLKMTSKTKEKLVTVQVSIECEQNKPRADSYIGYIECLLGVEEQRPVSMVFGNFTWNFQDVREEDFEDSIGIIKSYFDRLKDIGSIVSANCRILRRSNAHY